MSLKGKLIAGYFAIGLIYTLYSWLFGQYSRYSFAYNLGRGVIWPAAMFPAVGAVLGVIVLLVVIVGLHLNRR